MKKEKRKKLRTPSEKIICADAEEEVGNDSEVAGCGRGWRLGFLAVAK